MHANLQLLGAGRFLHSREDLRLIHYPFFGGTDLLECLVFYKSKVVHGLSKLQCEIFTPIAGFFGPGDKKLTQFIHPPLTLLQTLLGNLQGLILFSQIPVKGSEIIKIGAVNHFPLPQGKILLPAAQFFVDTPGMVYLPITLHCFQGFGQIDPIFIIVTGGIGDIIQAIDHAAVVAFDV